MTYRHTLLSVLLCAACLFCGCQDTQKPAQSSDEPYFMLDQLPQIGEYVDDIVYDRMNDQFKDTVAPGQDYGKLIPYVGAFRDFHFVDYGTGQWQDETMSVAKYGVMTDSGKIVTDAVYDWVNVTELSGGEYILQLYQSDHTGYGTEKMLFCNSDGSWVMEGEANLSFNFASWQEGFIIVTDLSKVSYDRIDGGPQVSVFDRQGNKLFSFSNCDASANGFREGYLILNFFSNYLSYEYTQYFVDTNGQIAFSQVHPGDDFQNGIAPAQSRENGLWGLFTIQGKWLVSPAYEHIHRDSGYYVAQSHGQYTIFDQQGGQVTRFSDKPGDNFYLLIVGDRFYWESNSYSSPGSRFFTDAITGQLLRHESTGKLVTDYWYGTDYFYLPDGRNTCIVDCDGKTVARLSGTGELERINDELFSLTKGHWGDPETTIAVYRFSDFQELWSATDNDPDTSVNYWIQGKYLVRSVYNISPSSMFEQGYCDILNPNTGKSLLPDIQEVQIVTIGEDSYIYCSDGIYTYAYSPELRLLMKVRNTSSD